MASEVTPDVTLAVGNTQPPRQRGSGHSVVLMTSKNSRLSAGRRSRGSWDEGATQLYRRGAYGSERLNPHRTQEGLSLTNDVQSRGQNRTRESRPSGIAGRLVET